MQTVCRLVAFAMVPATLGILWNRECGDPPPIKWQPFTAERHDALVASGTPVVLFARPSYHVQTRIDQAALDHPDIRRAYRNGGFQAMALDYHDWEGDQIRIVFKRYGHTKRPFAILTMPRSDPVHLSLPVVPDILRELPHGTDKRTIYAALFAVALGMFVVVCCLVVRSAKRTA